MTKTERARTRKLAEAYNALKTPRGTVDPYNLTKKAGLDYSHENWDAADRFLHSMAAASNELILQGGGGRRGSWTYA